MAHRSTSFEAADHSFGQDRVRPGERRTAIVIALTATMMVAEIAAGLAFGSMALLADGLHMASHTAALAIALAAYVYARRYARDRRFSFGTGKVNALAGFAGAIILALFALLMAFESTTRFFAPISIAFDQAIAVAVLGLAVNIVSAVILGHGGIRYRPGHRRGQHQHYHDHDHNLRSAYLHVLADALTSLFAIAALLAGRFHGLVWMDPLMGIVGAVLVARWSWGLLRDTASVLLDREAPDDIRNAIIQAIEGQPGNRIADLHVWSIGPGLWTAIVSIVAHAPRPPDHYKALLPAELPLVHPVVEVHRHPTA